MAKRKECAHSVIFRKLHPGFSLVLSARSIYKVYTFLGEVMSKHKVHGKDKKKSSQLVIRVEKAERDAFVALCDQLDTSAAREIRRFMRDLVAAHAAEGGGVSEVPPEAAAPEAESMTAAADPAATIAETDPASGDATPGESEKPRRKQKRAAP